MNTTRQTGPGRYLRNGRPRVHRVLNRICRDRPLCLSFIGVNTTDGRPWVHRVLRRDRPLCLSFIGVNTTDGRPRVHRVLRRDRSRPVRGPCACPWPTRLYATRRDDIPISAERNRCRDRSRPVPTGSVARMTKDNHRRQDNPKGLSLLRCQITSTPKKRRPPSPGPPL